MKKIISLLLALSFSLTLSGCRQGKKRYEAQFLQLFDTVTTVVDYMDSKDGFTEFSSMIRDTLNTYHQLYDIYHDYDGVQNIKTINDNAGKQPVKVDNRIIELLKFSKRTYAETGGRCNIALGAVLKIWHDYREAGIDNPESAVLPEMDELKEAARHTDIDKIIIDEENSTVFLSDPKMSLDVGAVAKGYAVEQTARLAQEKGYDSALISVGGNVRAIGSKDGKGKPWNIGVQNPDDNSELLMTEISGRSVVTSGIYQRYYTVNGREYHHIIDPQTLMPSEYYKAVTIICPDSGMADYLSTAVFNMPYEEGLAYINSLSGVEAVWVMRDGEVRYSDNFKQYLKSD